MSDKTLGNIVIPKADLPECSVVVRDGIPHVDCGSDWGTWNVKHLDRMRKTALEYVAAWVTAETWHASHSTRREDLMKELGSQFKHSELHPTHPLALAVDRIIALEGSAK